MRPDHEPPDITEDLGRLIAKYRTLNDQHFNALTDDEQWEFTTIVNALTYYRNAMRDMAEDAS